MVLHRVFVKHCLHKIILPCNQCRYMSAMTTKDNHSVLNSINLVSASEQGQEFQFHHLRKNHLAHSHSVSAMPLIESAGSYITGIKGPPYYHRNYLFGDLCLTLTFLNAFICRSGGSLRQCHNYYHTSANVACWGRSSYQSEGYGRRGNPSSSSDSHEEGNCRCGKPLQDLRLATVKKEGPNTGKQFYSCSECNFFKWKGKTTSSSSDSMSIKKTTWQEQRQSSSSGPANPDLISRDSDIDNVITIQSNKIKELTKHVQLLKYQMAVMQGILTNDKNLEENVTGYISEMSESIEREDSEVSETIQREEKKNNVMIWNLPESDSDAIENDLEMVMEVLKSVDSSVDAASIVSELTVSRLGKEKPDSGSKPRPIKLVMPSQLIKAKYLKNAMVLKTHEFFAKWQVQMAPDRTAKEYEERKGKYSHKVSEENEKKIDF